MSAPMRSMNSWGKTCRFWSYSRISYFRCQQKRSLQKAVSIPKEVFLKDKEGNLIEPAQCRFPPELDVDPVVTDQYEKNKLRYPKYHEGLMHFRRAPRLPKLLENNSRLVLAESEKISSSSFQADMSHLQQVYLRRQPPVDEKFQQAKLEALKEKFMAEQIKRKNTSFEALDAKEQKKLTQSAEERAKRTYKKITHGWHKIEYKDYSGLVYLGARLAPNYTVLLKIFDEMQKRDSDFVPESVLNVGSGVGTAVWAINALWGTKVSEYYNVDNSGYMNDLARKLMANDIMDPLNTSIPGVHFRQQIPSPEHVHNRFPMVVSAYLLMEQPSFEERLNLISLLWELTDEYLVLVEHGTSAGYRLIVEAREIIYQIGKDYADMKGHVFAPCTHDKLCPKLQFLKLPCTFQLEYRNLNTGKDIGQGDEKRNERYSYIVFRKGPKPEGKRYSRVTQNKVKSSFTHTHLCCPDGTLRNFVFSKTKQSPALFKCAKRCQEGDFLPFEWPQTDIEGEGELNEENSNDTVKQSVAENHIRDAVEHEIVTTENKSDIV